ncbi:heat shock factor-binding protein 1-like protein 1 [Protopterus annectens]|uniref:heat shock factor-binding protein 1-like protein 1 n=1 Tax=Protopterus annectens TaxID=7888 RepID=UPI001CFA3787|nr:heat shock factor-binding protein 1-like protein 1 [Protopterus annectens]XP_043922956.1 heat shock factor-binding protein 1-like protein 1 [Protopterus annectens]XP_043922957.1 heat shock factor-binding protein 1-like protein 1 [Protopterus annectens]XP_043922958.1 heat shock factor-binding protein 1-like protein 1 [Protopterus annectens]XP_043922959.1 heat shock factor-binding protein 1-like protein 1 [Protopterus annectens]
MMADCDPQTPKNLSEFVEIVFKRLQDKYEAMSNELISKMEDMGARIDDLDRDVADLMLQAGIEEYDTDLEKTKRERKDKNKKEKKQNKNSCYGSLKESSFDDRKNSS